MFGSTLYIDVQSLPPAGYCEKCGAEIYGPGQTCSRCEGEDR